MKVLLLLALGLAGVAMWPASAEELKKLPEGINPAKAYVLVEFGWASEVSAPSDLVISRYDETGSDLSIFDGGKAKREQARKGFFRVKERATRMHLLEVEPGLYIAEGAGGTSFSLGSRTLAATASRIVDLGVMKADTDFPEGESAAKFGVGDVLKTAFFGAFAGPKQEPRPLFIAARPRTETDVAIPSVLGHLTDKVVWLRTDTTFGNHLGGLVNRFGDVRKGRLRPTDVDPPRRRAYRKL